MKSCLQYSVASFVMALALGISALPARSNPPDPATSQEEVARVQTVQGLLRRREKLVRAENIKELQACDQELRTHPAPAGNGAEASAKRLPGKWRSGRHDYLYRPDGTWTLVPIEKGILHGRWQISGNQIEVSSGYATVESNVKYTLILLTDKDFVFTDGESVFCETRLASK